MAALHIILADDDADDRSLFKEALSNADSGAVLDTVENGQQLMDYLNKVDVPPPPHIIFLDINMPRKTGSACLKEIRSNEKFKDTPVVMFSTSSHSLDINSSFDNGATLYVSKSAFFENEVAFLRKLLNTDWEEYLPRPAKHQFVFAV